jgi:hypothetical protein
MSNATNQNSILRTAMAHSVSMDEINKSPGRELLDRGWQLRREIVAGKIERCASASFQS